MSFNQLKNMSVMTVRYGETLHQTLKFLCQTLSDVWHLFQALLSRKKLHRTNQGSNFLGGSFSNRDNVRAPIQFRRESQPQHAKRRFFLKSRPIHFHINALV